MSDILFEQFEQEIRHRKPGLADLLRPGLPADTIRVMLQTAGINGFLEPVITYFSWKDGSDPGLTILESSPFPESIYGFLDLRTAIEHFNLFHESLIYHPKFEEADRRYFPLFWDSSNSWIALDIDSNCGGRVVLLITESEQLVHEGYATVEEFLQDATDANIEDRPLTCFERL